MPLDTLTTIVAAAFSPDLVDLDAVKDELRIGSADTEHDAFLARAITHVSASIASYCNRVFAAETVRDVIYSRLGETQLQLSRFPAIAVSAVTLADGMGGQTALAENTDYIVDAPRGWLLRLGVGGVPISWYTTPTTVTYQAGYQDIPVDLQQAALRLIAARFHNRGRDPTLRSQSQPGLGDQTYWIGSVPGSQGPFPDEVLVILDSYRVPVGP